jgi:hypothetical protein
LLGHVCWKIVTDIPKGSSFFTIRVRQSSIGMCDPDENAVRFLRNVVNQFVLPVDAILEYSTTPL